MSYNPTIIVRQLRRIIISCLTLFCLLGHAEQSDEITISQLYLQHIISDFQHGILHPHEFSPELLQLVQQQWAILKPTMTQFGRLESITWIRKQKKEQVYRLNFEYGLIFAGITLSDDQKASSLRLALPNRRY